MNGDGNVKIESNRKAVKQALSEAIQRALTACGITAQGYATDAYVPVDTGRLKGSITYAVSKAHSQVRAPAKAEDGALHGAPEKDTLYLGTNVEYAPYVELGTHKQDSHPYLRPAFEQHIGEYERIIKSILEGN